jgi:poly-beta-1,6-N-acetyl-D-glucosamine biosynthesis protein PgaD
VQKSVIIDVRRQLGWQRRISSDASTLLLWATWLWLCRPLFVAIATLLDSHVAPRLRAARLAVFGTPLELEYSVLMLAGTSLTLLAWTSLTKRHVLRPETSTLPDYAGHFDLPPIDVQRGRASSICMVHHDEHGRIVSVEPRPLHG